MFNSTRRGRPGRRFARYGTVTVIEDQVRRSALRKAKLGFWLALFTAGPLTATVAAARWHPILALLVGIVAGLLVGGLAFVLVVCWPVLRILWWWAPEISLTLLVIYGWLALAGHTGTPTRLAVVGLAVGLPAGLPPVRRRVLAVGWCQVSRHRVRTCFSQFIISNRAGSLPLILWARPIPVGERIWVFLRPGLAITDLEGRLDAIAAACWASTVTVEKASDRNSAFLRLDIKRRDALVATVEHPLTGVLPTDPPVVDRDALPVPTALDLPDVTADTVTASAATPVVRRAEHKPERATRPAPPATPARPPSAEGGDLSDWV